MGCPVPTEAFPDLRMRSKFTSRPWWEVFNPKQTTSQKGDNAVSVATELMRKGHFPLWGEGKPTSRIELEIHGTDVLLWGKWRIQVKCDYNAGKGEDGSGTGNIFLQTAERNPLKRH